MSSASLADNRTAHEEQIIFVQPRVRQVVGSCSNASSGLGLDRGDLLAPASMNALSALPLASRNRTSCAPLLGKLHPIWP
jgi:hypothetical protein